MKKFVSVADLNLVDCLSALKVDGLRQMVKWLEVPNPLPTRKDDMVRVIKKHLTKQFIRNLWQQLNETDRLAVRETLHSPNRWFDATRFEAKYMTLPRVSVKDSRNLLNLPLRFLLYSPERDYSYWLIIPLDLSQILLEFVPPPPATTIDVQQDLPESVERLVNTYHHGDGQPATKAVKLTLCEMEHTAQQDLHSVLRLIDLGRISVSAKTRRTPATAKKQIAADLFGGDYFEPEVKKNSWDQVVGPIRAFAWPLLLQAGRLAEVKGSKLSLTRAGKRALDTAAADTLRHLWEKWLNNRLLDEFNRIEAIKGQFRGKGKRAMTSTSGRRIAIADALSQCPVGEWIHCDAFSQFMRAAGLNFEVTRDPWKLYISDVVYGSLGYAGHHDWSILQGRYILCLLFEYISTLGMVDIAYTHPYHAKVDFTQLWGAADELSWLSQYDGLEYFRLTALGAYCLGLTEHYTAQTAIERTPITVLPNLRLHTQRRLSTTERLTLETYSTAEADDVWRLDSDKILLALENGHNVDVLRNFLIERDEQPLPETVEGLLRKLERNAHALQVVGSAVLFECDSEQIATELANNKYTSKFCQLVGKKCLVVKNQKDKAFRKAIHDLGYGLKLP